MAALKTGAIQIFIVAIFKGSFVKKKIDSYNLYNFIRASAFGFNELTLKLRFELDFNEF